MSALVAVVVVLALLAAGKSEDEYRYEHLRRGEVETLVRIHKRTGKTEEYGPANWRERSAPAQSPPVPISPVQVVPVVQSVAPPEPVLVGPSNADLWNIKPEVEPLRDGFNISLYNGTAYRLEQVIIQIRVTNAAGKILADRNYAVPARTPALTTTRHWIDGGFNGSTQGKLAARWSVVSATTLAQP